MSIKTLWEIKTFRGITYVVAVAIYLLIVECVAHAEFDPQPEDFVDGCALEKINNCRYEVKFATRSGVTMTEVPIWPGDTTYKFITTPQPLLVVSTAADDTAAGTGARKVLVLGQAAFDWVSEEVTLDGTTPVQTVKSFDFIHRMYVTDAGDSSPDANPAVEDSAGAAGMISATTQSSGDLLAVIRQGVNITQQAIIRVPNGEQWLLHRVTTTEGGNREVFLRYLVRWPGTDIFQSRGEFNASASDDHRLLPPGTDMIVTGRTMTGMANAAIQIQFLRFGVERFPVSIPRSMAEF